MEKIHILEKEYCYCTWIKVDLSQQEFNSFVEGIGKINTEHGISLIDGIDLESQEVCFSFSQVKPSKPQEIKWAKAKNEQNAKKFLRVLSKHIDGRLYFNINHHIIKHK